jgi:hypothetical protein
MLASGDSPQEALLDAIADVSLSLSRSIMEVLQVYIRAVYLQAQRGRTQACLNELSTALLYQINEFDQLINKKVY